MQMPVLNIKVIVEPIQKESPMQYAPSKQAGQQKAAEAALAYYKNTESGL